ncbi:MAG: histidine phosphatase family protein, partial [Alphaproteobacteria bacterium]
MAEIYLVRHGQASFNTDDYDRLSDRGRQQSEYLGQYFTER